MKLLKEIISELLLVFKGNTLDVILPPLVFYVTYKFVSLNVAMGVSVSLSLFYLLWRIWKKEKWIYALAGFIGTLFAVGMVVLNKNASNIFLPDLIGTSVLVIATIITLVLKKPLASWVSHITRGWDRNWFYLDSVKPAYTEVTFFWLGFFIVRLAIEITLYLNSSVETYAIFNIISGLPVTIVVLSISYVYGIWRLHQLNGPGVEEFLNRELPPYKGQRKGF